MKLIVVLKIIVIYTIEYIRNYKKHLLKLGELHKKYSIWRSRRFKITKKINMDLLKPFIFKSKTTITLSMLQKLQDIYSNYDLVRYLISRY